MPTCRPNRAAKQGRAKRGFTLIEMLIALLVLSVAGLVVSSAVGNVAFQVWSLERRAAAHWVAENQLVRFQLRRRNNPGSVASGRESETVILAGRRWRVRQNVAATSHPSLYRVEIEVHELVEGRQEGPFGHLIGFVGRR